MHDVFSKIEAAQLWGVKIKTLEARLNRDRKARRDMLGTRKSGVTWMITREYMEDRYGSQKRTK